MCHFQAQNGPMSWTKSFWYKPLLLLSSTYRPKMVQCPEQNFFGTNYYYYFHLTIGPFHCAKFKKILTAHPELWVCTIFVPKMVCLPQLFWGEIINIILIYLLALFIVQNFEKILLADPDLWGCTIFGPKMAHLP